MVLIPADNPGPFTGDGNNTFLLDGTLPTLIDAGVGKASHVEAVARELGGRPLAQVIVTHGHSDHASGVPTLRARWPELVCMKWAATPEADWRLVGEGDVVAAGHRALRVLHTPGHAPDHVCLFDEQARDVYVGDMLMARGSVLIPGGKGGSLRGYLTSLRRLDALDATRFLPGHGPLIESPREVIAEALRHRERREQEVLACLAEGVADVDAIVSRLYIGLDEALRKAAVMTVTAHLDMLREDGQLSHYFHREGPQI